MSRRRQPGGGGGAGGGGFGLMSKAERHAAVPPPPSAPLSKQGYSTMSSITENALSATWGIPKKRSKTEEEYFEEEDEPQRQLEYIPAPGSPGGCPFGAGSVEDDSDSEEDPLDAYMAQIDSQVKKQSGGPAATAKGVPPTKPGVGGGDGTGGGGPPPKEAAITKKGVRDDIESEDIEESYYRYMEENPTAGLQDDGSDVEIEYDEDGNPIAPKKSKIIDPLPPIDHSTIEYEPFEKNFYIEHEEISGLSPEKVTELRTTLGIRVSGPNPPHPVTSFGHFGFDEALMKAIRKSDYTRPTPIQAAAVPAGLQGRDIIGIAKTGSGKTAAFIWPLLVHIMDQRQLEPGEGPIGLILAPTRELSQQIYNEAKRFGKVYNIQVVCAYGGGSKWEQCKALEGGAEIVVATPGRMIDLVKMKATNLRRVTFLVLDEADRMFDMGFEPQVRSICRQVRPDRQTLLFSATFKKKIKKLAEEALTDPVRISQGDEIGDANEDITQTVVVLQPSNKLPWLLAHIVEFQSQGSVLIFVTRKSNAEELSAQLKLQQLDNLLFHGDMDQIERNRVITAFRKKEVDIMVATDVAARGLDIPHIRTVVNYDMAKDIDTHTHRIGRTGRAGEKGAAYSLVTTADKDFAGCLVRNLESVGQPVPGPLLELAMQSAWFRKSRFKGGKGKGRSGADKAGLGFRERPGLGAPPGSGPDDPHQFSDVIPSAPPTPSTIKTKSHRGPGMDRLQAMKAAFKSQYQSQFRASEDQSWEQTLERGFSGVAGAGATGVGAATATGKSPATATSVPIQPPPASPAPGVTSASSERQRVRRSRWDNSSEQ